MDKVKILMEWYKIPEAMALRIDEKLQVVSLHEVNIPKPVIKSTNKEVIERVRKAEPIHEVIPIGDQSGKVLVNHDENGIPIRTIKIGGAKLVTLTPQILEVKFIVKGKPKNETLSINDPAIIELIRLRLCAPDVIPMNPKKPHRPKIPHTSILKELANELMNGSNDEKYEWNGFSEELLQFEKHYRIGDIFSLYLESWSKMEYLNKLQNVVNLLRPTM